MPMAGKTTLALRYHKFGKPQDVLTAEEVPLPQVGPGQALVRMLAASINPSDFGMIMGSYGRLKELPAVAGNEGVAEVEEIGPGVKNIRVGQWVRMPVEAGSWRQACVAEASGLFVVQEGLPAETAATAFVNPPTAWLLLHDFVKLQPGDWVIQNAGNSALGLCVIQLARHLGLKTLNVVRRPELEALLREHGADRVVTEEDEYYKNIDDLTGGNPIRLGLNSVGGPSAVNLIQALAPGGTLVTFGAMDFTRVRFPTRHLIFNDIRLRGFWLDKWRRSHTPGEVQALYDRIFALLGENILRPATAKTYPLSEYKEALAHALQPRFGKILFTADP